MKVTASDEIRHLVGIKAAALDARGARTTAQGFELPRSVFLVTRSSHRADMDARAPAASPVGTRAPRSSVSRGGPELWTAQSLLEPIFVPASMAQRQSAASAASAAISHSQVPRAPPRRPRLG
jgi:hypothetical protein